MGCGATKASQKKYEVVTDAPQTTVPPPPESPSQWQTALASAQVDDPADLDQNDVETGADEAEDNALRDVWASVQEVNLCYVQVQDDSDAITGNQKNVDNATKAVNAANPGSKDPVSKGPGCVDAEAIMPFVSAYGFLLGRAQKQVAEKSQESKQGILSRVKFGTFGGGGLNILEVEALAATSYDSADPLHWRLLKSCWVKVMSERHAEPCPGRSGAHWELVGFQGTDPVSDLRGAGILGLLHLLHLAGHYPKTTQAALQLSHNTTQQFPLACVSLNLTMVALATLRAGRISKLCARAKSSHAALAKLHACLFHHFYVAWRDRKLTVIQFGDLLNELKKRAQKPYALLRDFERSVPEQAEAARFAAIRPIPPEGMNATASSTSGAKQNSKEEGFKKTRGRCTMLLARANDSSPEEEMREIFSMMDKEGTGVITPDQVREFLCGERNIGSQEVEAFIRRTDLNQDGLISFEEFSRTYALLNAYWVRDRHSEMLMRKPGSIKGEQFAAEDLKDCQLHVLDQVGSCTIDAMEGCEVIIGPCDGPAFLRDCARCVFHVCCRQLRTRRCSDCQIFLYSATEPIIELSDRLEVAPWIISYPRLTAQFIACGFTPANYWNAVYDFNAPQAAGKKNWSTMPPEECTPWKISIEGLNMEPESPLPPVTDEVLKAPPLKSVEHVGHALG